MFARCVRGHQTGAPVADRCIRPRRRGRGAELHVHQLRRAGQHPHRDRVDPVQLGRDPGPADQRGGTERGLPEVAGLGPVPVRRFDARGQPPRGDGAGIPDHQPRLHRGQRAHPRRCALYRGPEPGAAGLQPRAGRTGRRRHRRGLYAGRASVGDRAAPDHRAQREPRRPRLRGVRGPRDGDRADQLRRQPRLLRPPAAPRPGDDAGRPVPVDHPVRHLRRRPRGRGPAAVARLLSVARLCRRADPVGHAGAVARPRRLLPDLPHPGGPAIPLRSGWRHLQPAGDRPDAVPVRDPRGPGRPVHAAGDRPDGAAARAAGDAAGPDLHPRPARVQPQPARPYARHHLRHRARPPRLRRAHRHRGQRHDARPCDPAGIRDGGGRPLQPARDPRRRRPHPRARLLLAGRGDGAGGLDRRAGHPRRRRGGAADGRLGLRGELLGAARGGRRLQLLGIELPRPRADAELRHRHRVGQFELPAELHRALLPEPRPRAQPIGLLHPQLAGQPDLRQPHRRLPKRHRLPVGRV